MSTKIDMTMITHCHGSFRRDRGRPRGAVALALRDHLEAVEAHRSVDRARPVTTHRMTGAFEIVPFTAEEMRQREMDYLRASRDSFARLIETSAALSRACRRRLGPQHDSRGRVGVRRYGRWVAILVDGIVLERVTISGPLQISRWTWGAELAPMC